MRPLKAGGFFTTLTMRWVRDEPGGKARAPQGITRPVRILQFAERWRAVGQGRTGWGSTPEDALQSWKSAMWNGWKTAGQPPEGGPDS